MKLRTFASFIPHPEALRMTLKRLLVCFVVAAGLAGVALVARDSETPG